jgi:hypothetical protein
LLEAKQSHGEPDAADQTCEQSKGWDLANVHFPAIRCSEPGDPNSIEDESLFVEGRTKLANSYAVLGGMLVFWVGTAMVFLKMRDIQ